jgi:ADP-sugar diphosphatase
MTILTHQPRPAATSLDFVEIPAGMLDKGELISKARGELEEEVGLVVKDEDLFDMTAKALEGESTDGAPKEAIQNAMYPSPGGCDEAVSLMLCQKRLTREKMEELNGKATGLRHEGEVITLELIPLERLYRRGARDAKALGALCLYLELGREGLLPAMPMMPDAS